MLNSMLLMRRWRFLLPWLLSLAVASTLHATVALLVEEPYGEFGHMNPTGHAAIYLSDICAESPTQLRPCFPGESGAVISRYEGIHGYDWIAMPLIPYLYAVDWPGEVPAFADEHTVARLRDDYRRAHLEGVIPDGPNGSVPKGEWDQLLGAAYIRRIYVFEIETSGQQDSELIAKLNSQPNRSHFNLLFDNCADFSRRIIDFYYPGALHRSFIADAGISTPKQMAKALVSYNGRHSELELAKFVIPQVPGSLPRSRAVHGILESLVKSKKYSVPLFLLHPWIESSVAVAYVARGRFNPARNAAILDTPTETERMLAGGSRLKLPIAPSAGATVVAGETLVDPCIPAFHFGEERQLNFWTEQAGTGTSSGTESIFGEASDSLIGLRAGAFQQRTSGLASDSHDCGFVSGL
jgi:hypothetical protein